MNYRRFVAALSMVPCIWLSGSIALADAVSEAFDKNPTVYSKERPDKSFYGTGESGRLNEASALRFQGEQDLSDNNIDQAIREFGKAVELDPGDPTGHVLYARAITKKFYSKKGDVDEKLLTRCITEWKLIWYHDADYLEQCEAKQTCRPLVRIARALEKARKDKQKMLAEDAKKNPMVAQKPGPAAADTKADVTIPMPKVKAPPVNADPAIGD